jgi:membrane protease YdiL (CAAX protease family)
MENRSGGQLLGWSEHLIFLLTFFIVFFVVTLFYEIYLQIEGSTAVSQTLAWGFITAVEILVVTLVQTAIDKYMENRRPGLSFFLQFKARASSLGLRLDRKPLAGVRDVALILLLVMVPLDFLGYLIPGVLPYMASTDVGSFFGTFTPIEFVTFGILYNIITGIREEFVFRGYTLRRLVEKGRRPSAWIVSAAFFGAMHLQFSDLVAFPVGAITWVSSALLIGLLFAGYVLKTGKIWVVMAAHGIGNVISSTVIFFYLQDTAAATANLLLFLIRIYLLFFFAGGFLVLIYWKYVGNALRNLRNLGRQVRTLHAMDVLIMVVVFLALWGIGHIIFV